MTDEDRLNDVCNTILSVAIGLIIIGAMSEEQKRIDKRKNEKPKRKPKGKWRYKQYEEWDKH